MKNLNKFIGCCAFAMPLLTACTGNFDSMNTNPAAANKVSPAYTLPTVIELVTNVSCDPYQRGENLYTQFYAQYFAMQVGTLTATDTTMAGPWPVSGTLITVRLST